ncbi:hypothetical protein C809_04219 [Lachnospiraceae bacterium MD335]|jgi:hypothetical protein|nr:hypothetical protein C809_04219 [Lachnospiraceae bacterium MD335]
MVNFNEENVADANFPVGLLTLSEIVKVDNSFSKPLRETDLSFSSNHIIGELNPDFESIPFDIDGSC